MALYTHLGVKGAAFTPMTPCGRGRIQSLFVKKQLKRIITFYYIRKILKELKK
jgi:hypothetical protein